MARIRSLKPEFWSDQKLARMLSRDARMLYLGLWNLADEHARCMGDPRWIKGQVFPYEDDLTPERVGELLDELVRARRAHRYIIDADVYLYLPRLADHQRLEPDKVPSRLPEPDPCSDLHTQVRADKSAPDSDESALARAFAGSREQVAGSKGQGKTSSPAPSAADAEFAEFWTAYPRKVGKGHARKVWDRIAKATRGAVIEGARRVAADPNLPGREFIPHPATWLTRTGWEDEPFPPRNRSPSTTDARVAAGVDLVAKYRAEEERQPLLAIEGSAS